MDENIESKSGEGNNICYVSFWFYSSSSADGHVVHQNVTNFLFIFCMSANFCQSKSNNNRFHMFNLPTLIDPIMESSVMKVPSCPAHIHYSVQLRTGSSDFTV